MTNLPHMEKKISYNDFWNKLNKPVMTKSNKSTKELLEWAEKVKKAEYTSYTDVDHIKNQ